MKSDVAAFLAIWGALASSVTIGWNLYRDMSDTGRLRVHCFIGKIVGSSEASPDIDYLAYSVTNTGKRPIMVTNVGGRHREANFIISPRNLPRMLGPGEYFTEWTEDLSKLNKNLVSLFASDSLGKEWSVNKKALRKLLSDATQISAMRNPPES